MNLGTQLLCFRTNLSSSQIDLTCVDLLAMPYMGSGPAGIESMPQITIDSTNVGQEIAQGPALLNSITMDEGPDPSAYRSYFTLVDVRPGVENGVYNFDPSTSFVNEGSVLVSDGGILFNSLVLKNIPAGSSFTLDYALPPTLDSLSPDTAVSGGDDFVLSCIGTNFTSGTVIRFGPTVDEPTTFVSETEVTTIVKSSIFAPAVVPVAVHIGNVWTKPLDFTFTEPAQG